MPPSTAPPGHYSLPRAGRYVGKSASAMRKRFDAGQLDGLVRNGVVYVKAKPIEDEREEMLARMQAVDARPGKGPRLASASSAEPDRQEIERLRAENRRLQSVIESLTAAVSAARDAVRNSLADATATQDALNQFLMPHNVADST